MGTIIRQGAAPDTITSHVRQTLVNAAGMGAPYAEDAQRTTIANRMVANLAALDEALGKQRAQTLHADDTIAWVKDRLYDATGRRAHDHVFGLIYGEGIDTYRNFSAFDKPEALELNALAIELTRHPNISPELVQEVTHEPRAEAKALADINAELAPMRTENRFLSMQFQMNARRAQTELSRLEKFWKSQGETEHDIHLIIPAAKPRAAQVAIPPTAQDMVQATLGELVPVTDAIPANGA